MATPAVKQLGRRELNKADKQRRIIESATELFQAKGFEETTTAEIARAAGIGTGTLYLYVGSKEDLLVMVFRTLAEPAWHEAFGQVDPKAPLVDQLLTAFGVVIERHEADPRMATAFFKHLRHAEEPARTAFDAWMSQFFDRLEDLFLNARTTGRLDPEVPINALARNIWALWFTQMHLRTNGALSYDEFIEQLDAGVRLALWGMEPKS